MDALPPRLFLAKYLRAKAAYHTAHGGTPEFDLAFIRAIKDEGVVLEPARVAGQLTTAQCIRYAEQLEKLDATQGAA